MMSADLRAGVARRSMAWLETTLDAATACVNVA